jgi:hypothetical protein
MHAKTARLETRRPRIDKRSWRKPALRSRLKAPRFPLGTLSGTLANRRETAIFFRSHEEAPLVAPIGRRKPRLNPRLLFSTLLKIFAARCYIAARIG